jgi:hypothetical protein
MQRLHRSTIWRRKRRAGQVKHALGRRQKGRNRLKICRRIAQLVNARRLAGRPIEPKDVPSNSPAPWETAIVDIGYPEGLLMVCCADALKLGTRQKAPSKRSSQLESDKTLLRQEYPGLSEEEVRMFAEQQPEWLSALRGSNPQSALQGTVSVRAQCPSRFFPVSRQMVSWWRRHDEYDECLRFIGGLTYDRQRPSRRPRKQA